VDEHVFAFGAGPLRQLVRYTGYRQAGRPPGMHRGLPSPFLTFIVTLDDPITVEMGQSPATYTTLIGGLHASPAFITHDGAQSGIQISLSPLGARALLGLPAGELSCADYDAADILGPLADELHSRVRAAQSWQSRFSAVDAILMRLLDRSGGQRPCEEITFAWRRLLSTGGAVGIGALAEQTGWSARHLQGRFTTEIGLSPKVAARVVRFDRARRLLRNRSAFGLALDLAGIAADCGYFDQSHLDRDFRAFAGCSPTRWLADEFRNIQAFALPADDDGGHDYDTGSSSLAEPAGHRRP
jgi:AraC-like DNA-binding protein